MEYADIGITFAGTMAEEVTEAVKELRLVPVARLLGENGNVPEELKEHLTTMIAALADLLSDSTPDIYADPEKTLRTISRDINLARLLQQRGIFRLYRIAYDRTEINVDGDVSSIPVFMKLTNPDTGSPFATQNEFLTWFCREAKVSRGLVFQRFAAIDRLMTLGFSFDEAFRLFITKPFAIQETLHMVAEWGKSDARGEIVSLQPGVVEAIAERIDPDYLETIRPILSAATTDPDNEQSQTELLVAAKPVIRKLIGEVADHDRAKDALDFVRHDVLSRPEISYYWDTDLDALVVEIVRKSIDKAGTEHISPPIRVPLIPDTPALPQEIRNDLIKRLPIKNRTYLDI